MTDFIKHDKGKLRYDLIPNEVIVNLAKLKTVELHTKGNEHVRNATETTILQSVYTHLAERRLGRSKCKQSKQLHLAHVLDELGTLLGFDFGLLRTYPIYMEHRSNAPNNVIRYDLIPPQVLFALADVYTFGAKKYDDDNWKKVDTPARYVAALFRHIEAWRTGATYDVESGKPTLAHAMTCASFLLYFDLTDPNFKLT